MSQSASQRTRRASGPPERRRRAADGLALAASPTFAMMALLTAAPGGSPVETFCLAAPTSSLRGMATMYLLMSAFHAAPWLKLVGAKIRAPV